MNVISCPETDRQKTGYNNPLLCLCGQGLIMHLCWYYSSVCSWYIVTTCKLDSEVAKAHQIFVSDLILSDTPKLKLLAIACFLTLTLS